MKTGGQVRLTAWNCLQGTDKKLPMLLERLAPDVAVVPESSRTPAVAVDSLLGNAIPHTWTGQWPTKGLGIYAPTADRLEVIPSESDTGARHGLAVRAQLKDDVITVLGLWTTPHKGGPWRSAYMNAAESIFAGHADLLADGEAIVAGDFNCSAQSDPDGFPRFLAQVRERYGLRSAYHDFTGQQPGSEADMTLWWRKKEEAGYHCDLILVPESWSIMEVAVGTHAEWGHRELPASSDHAPVSVVLERRRGSGGGSQ